MNRHISVLINSVKVPSILVLCSLAHNGFAGAWVPDVGEGYTKYAVANYQSDEFEGAELAESIEFTGTNVSFYGEYGFAPNMAVYGTLLYQQLEQKSGSEESSESSGLGDAELGIRYQWISEPFVLSSAFLVKLPYLYDEDDTLPRGNGQEDYEARVLLGKSLNKYGYFGIEAGYRLRTEAPSDEYRYLFEYGFSTGENMYFRTKIDSIVSAKNADTVDSDADGNNLTATSEYDLTKWELTAGWNFGKPNDDSGRWGVELTYRNDIGGDNTLIGEGIELGLTRVF